MLRKLRIGFALIFLICITLLFLDFTGSIHAYLGWMAKIQFIPALLALNSIIVIALIVLTWIFGRIYCSVICPLGIFQDVISRFGRFRKKNRFSYSPAIQGLRYTMLAVFTMLLLTGFSAFAGLIEPYSMFGRMVYGLVAPVYEWVNNIMAFAAERMDSYAFYTTDIRTRGFGSLGVAIITCVALSILAWRNGRTYCNTICPVGTVLGFFARFSLFKHRIDPTKCNNCTLCARNCKAACIDSKNYTIDYSRCVTCFDCLGKCKRKAISYTTKRYGMPENAPITKKQSDSADDVKKCADDAKERAADVKQEILTNPTIANSINETTIIMKLPTGKKRENSRREFLTLSALAASTAAIKAQEKKVDGGLAFITDKKRPVRQTPIAPPGAQGIRNFATQCTACQLCISVCPNEVLRPSNSLHNFLQPEVSYESGYCRPECTLCSEVCPAGAILPISTADKSATQIGHAVWIENNCVTLTDGVSCGNCERHCPTGAIEMISSEADNPDSPQIPIINVERCIGCGACENLCPSRPFSAIYVEGHERHRII